MTAPSVQAVCPSENNAEGNLEFIAVRNIPLNFQLGEWRIFSISRRLAVYDCRNGKPRSFSPDTFARPSDAEGYLIRALPAQLGSLLAAKQGGQWFERVLREYPRHQVDMTIGYDAYLAKFSGKTRSTLKRKLRKFQDLSGGTIEWKEYRTPSEMEEFFPLARALSARTYQERLLRAGLPATAAFKSETVAAAARDNIRAYILFLNGRPVSYLFLPIDGARILYAHLGYDPAMSEHSPGTVLQLLAMERLFAERRYSIFDFTEGAGQHKELFATHSDQCVDVLVLRRKMSTLALASAHTAFTKSEAALSRLLDGMGLKKRAKMLLRGLGLSRE